MEIENEKRLWDGGDFKGIRVQRQRMIQVNTYFGRTFHSSMELPTFDLNQVFGGCRRWYSFIPTAQWACYTGAYTLANCINIILYFCAIVALLQNTHR